jgi:hypothetical protein
MRFGYLILFLAMSISQISFSQFNLRPNTKKEQRQLKNPVLNHTDHGYFGMETGLLFDFSQSKANDPSYASDVDNKYIGAFQFDFLPTYNGRIFAGYRYKSHCFELGVAGLHSRSKTTDGNKAIKYFGTLLFGYYYKLPIKSDFYNLLIGPEIGWAFGFAGDYIRWEEHGFPPPELEIYATQQHFLYGLSIRNEFKLSKRLNFFSQVSGTFVTPMSAKYMTSWGPSGPSYTTLNVIPINFVISFGLKFDFYSKKKKQQTFDQLGIEDPYKTQLYK